MKMTREQLFAAPTVVRRAEERIERGKVAVSPRAPLSQGGAIDSTLRHCHLKMRHVVAARVPLPEAHPAPADQGGIACRMKSSSNALGQSRAGSRNLPLGSLASQAKLA
jgi:hypothetical protein